MRVSYMRGICFPRVPTGTAVVDSMPFGTVQAHHQRAGQVGAL